MDGLYFQEFAQTAECVFKKSERRADLDKWYVRLVIAMFEHIPRVASEHQRTPPEVIKMGNSTLFFNLLVSSSTIFTTEK